METLETQRKRTCRKPARGFTLVELMIVVVILGILAMLIVPTVQSAQASARENSAMDKVRTLRQAVLRYSVDHQGTYPAANMIHNQLTQWSDKDGNVSGTRTVTHTFPPYIDAMPAPGVGPNATSRDVSPLSGPYPSGWVYDETSGVITINADGAVDAAGKAFGDY